MELNSGMILEQRQQMSQAQIQSLEILSMDCTELYDFLQNEYLDNPLLECNDSQDLRAGRENVERIYEQAPPVERTYEGTAVEEDAKRRDIPAPNTVSIREEIIEQIPPGACRQELVEYMIDGLDDNGYYTMSAEEVAAATGASVEEVSWTLHILQELEPYGIFAPDLRHCLMRQLEMMDLGKSSAYRIVEAHLDDVAAGRISAISRALHLSTAEVRKCIEQITRLKPRPIAQFGSVRNDYVIPDILLHKEDDKWEIELNDHWVEDYHISDYYLRMMQEAADPELSAYFRKRLERVRFVMNSITQRRQTIRQIAEDIVALQPEYLEGIGYLRPMTMSDVAEQIGIHTSTVSRAIRGKYIQCPRGTILMKSLFSASVSTADVGEDSVGVMQIKEMLRELIRNEDRRRPYSDQQIMRLLRERDIAISRRAVAKYREELGIKSSYDRRQF